MAALEMLNSRWYAQTPKRVEKLIDLLLEQKMSNKDDNNIFIKSLAGVVPLKKNNKITKPIPKPTKSDTPRIIIKETVSDKIYEKIKNVPKQQKTAIQKSDINKKLKKNKIPDK